MRALLQRVSHASVRVDGKLVSEIQNGLLIFLGVAEDDEREDLEFLLKKIPALRIFPDEQGKMNLAVSEVQGQLLVISQFTLIADTAKGNRHSFFRAAKAEKARNFYEVFISRLKNTGLRVETGIFAADMQVQLTNEGPVTILLDSKEVQ